MNNNKFTPELVKSKAGKESVFIYFLQWQIRLSL